MVHFAESLYMKYPPAVVMGVSYMIAVDGVAVLARFYVRKSRAQRLLSDDWLTIPALALNIGIAIAVFVGVYSGIFKEHSRELVWDEVDGFLVSPSAQAADVIEMAIVIMSTLSLTLIRLSLLYFFKRVLSNGSTGVKKAKKTSFQVLTAASTIWGVCFGFTLLLISFLTCAEGKGEACVDMQPFRLVFSTSDFFINCCIFGFPVHTIRRLQLSRKQKIGIGICFLLGAQPLVSSMFRVLWDIAAYTDNLPYKFGATPRKRLIPRTTGIYHLSLETLGALSVACLPMVPGLRHTRLGQKFTQVLSPSAKIGSEDDESNIGKKTPVKKGICGDEEV